MQTSKMKILGASSSGITMLHTIQPGEYSTGSGTDGCLYILDADDNPKLFNVERDNDGTVWLNNNWGNPDNEWNPENEWVFVRPRNSLHFAPAPMARVRFA
jgi:hypothetical protein